MGPEHWGKQVMLGIRIKPFQVLKNARTTSSETVINILPLPITHPTSIPNRSGPAAQRGRGSSLR